MPADSQSQQRLSPAYIAGFLDGEGHICILEANRYTGKTHSFRLNVGFTNRDISVLAAIKEEYGGTIHAKVIKNPKASLAYGLQISNRAQVERILRDTLPYLIVKKQQAELGLSFLSLGLVKMKVVEYRRIHPTKGGLHPVSQPLPGEQEKRAEMKRQLSQLNARGVTCLQ